MRISVQLPKVEPDVYEGSKQCPRCGGPHFKPHGVKGEKKSVRDPAFQMLDNETTL